MSRYPRFPDPGWHSITRFLPCLTQFRNLLHTRERWPRRWLPFLPILFFAPYRLCLKEQCYRPPPRSPWLSTIARSAATGRALVVGNMASREAGGSKRSAYSLGMLFFSGAKAEPE